MHRLDPDRQLPAISTAALIMTRNGLVQRVSRSGTIRVFHNQVFVSNTLYEDYVGLEEVDDGVYDLFFCFYHIGRYELRTNKIQRYCV